LHLWFGSFHWVILKFTKIVLSLTMILFKVFFIFVTLHFISGNSFIFFLQISFFYFCYSLKNRLLSQEDFRCFAQWFLWPKSLGELCLTFIIRSYWSSWGKSHQNVPIPTKTAVPTIVTSNISSHYSTCNSSPIII
jgi:hypothetical protein